MHLDKKSCLQQPSSKPQHTLIVNALSTFQHFLLKRYVMGKVLDFKLLYQSA